MSDEQMMSDKLTWPVVINLVHPIEFGKDHIASIEVRRGRLGDLKGVKLGEQIDADALMLVASRMSGQPLKVIERLDADDASPLLNIALDFFGKCLHGGGQR